LDGIHRRLAGIYLLPSARVSLGAGKLSWGGSPNVIVASTDFLREPEMIWF
jgi:hypothetical protein